jgi:mitogen-activated protein kinase kinase kinase 7
MTRDETDRLGTTSTAVTKITPRMRVQWAVDVAKGVQALHEIEGGPIVHADIQAKQFLVSPTTGRVKVNDFNRCRFMGQRIGDKPSSPCPFRIPSAPGKMRAPEEYKYDPLTEKLDIYSVANILYSLLTKQRPWEDLSQAETKQFIKKGKIPKIWVADDIIMPDPLKEALVHINERAYQLDPRKRISAAEMAEELGKVLEQLEQLEQHQPSL